jgi:hypothetical protein
MIEHETRIEYVNTRTEQLTRDWPTASTPARHAVGQWLIRLGSRLAPERPASAFAHEALPRC